MQLTVTGHHVDITPSLRAYVDKRFEKVLRHFDSLIDIHCVLTVEKLRRKAEATIHVSGAALHADATEPDMYAAIDVLSDRLDRLVCKHKEKLTDHHAAQAQKSAREL